MFKSKGKKAAPKIRTREKDHDSNDEVEEHTIVVPKTKNPQNRKMQISTKPAIAKSSTLSFEDDVY